MSRFRGWIQAGATLLTNLHLPNFLKGGLYQGAGKTVCVPGLNCYSCPAASGACPIGAFQAVVGSSKFSFSYYIIGFLILLGVLLGRFICGFLCPFGWFQELLHKIPTKKLSTKRLKPLTYLKYAVLLVMVFLLPAFLVNDVGMGDPFFCKYLCPQGVLEGAIPLSLANSGIRAALGKLFTWKFSILLSVIALSILFYRPFCKWLCPLGAFYGEVNGSFVRRTVELPAPETGRVARAEGFELEGFGIGVAHFERGDRPAGDRFAGEAGFAEESFRVVENLRAVGDAADVFDVELQCVLAGFCLQDQRFSVVGQGSLKHAVEVNRGIVPHVLQFERGLPCGNGDCGLVEDVSEFHPHIAHRKQFVGLADLAVNLRQRGAFGHFQLLRPCPEQAGQQAAEQ